MSDWLERPLLQALETLVSLGRPGCLVVAEERSEFWEQEKNARTRTLGD